MSTLVQPALSSRLAQHESHPWHVRPLLPLLSLFGAAKLLLQSGLTLLSIHAGYGLHRDELYYLVCGHRLAAGYVDQPPLVALQARLSEILFGYHHLVAFRLLPNVAGALTVILAGLIASALGGARKAATLAMLGVLTAPVFLATQGFLSMNAWDPVFWMAAVLAVLRLLAVPEATGWWLLLGAGTGLGLENKASTVFFVVSLLLAMLATPARHLFRRRGFLLAAGVTVLLALPNLWWQGMHGFPTWEWLKDVRHSNKDVLLPPSGFLLAQVFMLSPFHLLLWMPGAAWLLAAREARPWRVAGWLYVFFLLIMLALHAKDYYLAPIYPLCFAAGAVFWTDWATTAFQAASRTSSPRTSFQGRGRFVMAYAIFLAASVPITAPFAMPLISPDKFSRYARTMHFYPMESEQHAPATLPAFFADHLGWQELANGVSRVYHSLPPEQQRQTGIITSNYGQASAINILGKPLGLPAAISGHQNYWMWGPDGYTGKEMIVVTNQPLEKLLHFYRACTIADQQTSPYAIAWEQRYIYVCQDRIQPFASSWNAVKLYF